MSKLKKTADIFEKSMNAVFTFCGFLAVAFVLIITGFLVVSGIPAIKEIGIIDFLFGKKGRQPPQSHLTVSCHSFCPPFTEQQARL